MSSEACRFCSRVPMHKGGYHLPSGVFARPVVKRWCFSLSAPRSLHLSGFLYCRVSPSGRRFLVRWNHSHFSPSIREYIRAQTHTHTQREYPGRQSFLRLLATRPRGNVELVVESGVRTLQAEYVNIDNGTKHSPVDRNLKRTKSRKIIVRKTENAGSSSGLRSPSSATSAFPGWGTGVALLSSAKTTKIGNKRLPPMAAGRRNSFEPSTNRESLT